MTDLQRKKYWRRIILHLEMVENILEDATNKASDDEVDDFNDWDFLPDLQELIAKAEGGLREVKP